MPGNVTITIDGPAGTGKSSVAYALASRLGLEFLDTGAMYRAAAVIAIEDDIDPEDGVRLAGALSKRDLHFDWACDPPRLLLGERDLTERIRDADVGAVVSIVARQPEVRAALVDQQRRIRELHPRIVSEGRDQGSVVFPDADLRFYLDASPEVRARRRVDQLTESGRASEYDAILEEIRTRDQLDSTRAVGPLVKPDGAIEVDTSVIAQDQVVDRLEQIVRTHIAAKLNERAGPDSS